MPPPLRTATMRIGPASLPSSGPPLTAVAFEMQALLPEKSSSESSASSKSAAPSSRGGGKPAAAPATAASPPSSSSPPLLGRCASLGCCISTCADALEALLLFFVIAIGGYAGTMTRIGFQYYKSWKGPEANFNVIYANIIGSFILGVVSVFQPGMMRAGGSRCLRLTYVFIATGLCGSITSFSTWHGEANKLFLLQLDDTGSTSYAT